jgi:uncharacterized protein
MGGTPLLYTTLDDHAAVAKTLIKHGADLHIPDNWGLTALHMAANKGALQVLKLLLAAGANPNLKNKDAKTPLDISTVGAAQILRRHLARRKKAPARSIHSLPVPGGIPSRN